MTILGGYGKQLVNAAERANCKKVSTKWGSAKYSRLDDQGHRVRDCRQQIV